VTDAPPNPARPDPGDPRGAGTPPRGSRPRPKGPTTPRGIPLSQLGERDDRGISRLDIAWRAAEVLATRNRPPLPRWVDAAVVALLAVFLVAGTFAGLRATPYGGAEAAQLALTKDAGTLVTDPLALVPGGDTTQPAESLRLVQGAFTRYLAAAGWYAAGGRADDVPALPAGDPPGAEAAPPERLLTAARVAPVLFTAAAIPILFFLGLRFGGRRVALIAVVAAFVHPSVLLAGRQVQDVGAVLAFGLGAVLVAVVVSERLAAGVNPGAGRWTALVVLCGFALAAGQGALGFVGGAVAWVLAGFGEAYLRNRRALLAALPMPAASRYRTPPLGTPVRAITQPGRPLTPPGGVPKLVAADAPDVPTSFVPPGSIGSFALSLAGAVLVWVAVSPALWGWLPERLATRSAERSALVSQGLLPDPGALGHADAAWRLVTGPFLDAPDQVPTEALSAGLPYSGWALPVGLLLALATLAGLALLAVAAAAGPERRAEPRPVSFSLGAGRLRWLAARQIGRRDAVAFLGWVAVVAACAVAWPSERSADRVPLVPVAALAAAVAVVVAAGWLTAAGRDVARRRLAR
jgi:hypothetical protein